MHSVFVLVALGSTRPTQSVMLRRVMFVNCVNVYKHATPHLHHTNKKSPIIIIIIMKSIANIINVLISRQRHAMHRTHVSSVNITAFGCCWSHARGKLSVLFIKIILQAFRRRSYESPYSQPECVWSQSWKSIHDMCLGSTEEKFANHVHELESPEIRSTSLMPITTATSSRGNCRTARALWRPTHAAAAFD